MIYSWNPNILPSCLLDDGIASGFWKPKVDAFWTGREPLLTAVSASWVVEHNQRNQEVPESNWNDQASFFLAYAHTHFPSLGVKQLYIMRGTSNTGPRGVPCIIYMCVCAYVCVRAHMCMCVSVWAREPVRCVVCARKFWSFLDIGTLTVCTWCAWLMRGQWKIRFWLWWVVLMTKRSGQKVSFSIILC